MTPSRSIVARLSAFAGLALASAAASAQPCALYLEATPKVITTGQYSTVEAHAWFPGSGFAFASSQFNVQATAPTWTAVSGGVVAGPWVMGIQASQSHLPPNGPIASPDNPFLAWRGRLTPISSAPAFIQVSATPLNFWYYPSELTSSPAPCNALPGEAWIFVNPLQNAGVYGAPFPGDVIRTDGDGFWASANDGNVGLGFLRQTENVQEDSVVALANPAPSRLSSQMEIIRNGRTVASPKLIFERSPTDPEFYTVRVEAPEVVGLQMIFTGPGASPRTIHPVDGVFPVQFRTLPDLFHRTAGKDHKEWIEVTSFQMGIGHSSSQALEVKFGNALVSNYTQATIGGSLKRSTPKLQQYALGGHAVEAVGSQHLRVVPRRP